MINKRTSLKINFIYNIIYQLLILILPLVTAPYLSRIFGASGIGIYSYTYSIVYYFMLLTLLGVKNYGNRCIAKTKNNKQELSRNFWGIYLFQLLIGTIMLIIYLIYAIFIVNKYKVITMIQTLYIISAMLDINWFYFGLEEFKTTITRNIFIKILSLVLIFTFVKSSSDLWKYTLIMSGMTLLSQLVLWNHIRKKIIFIKILKEDFIKHIKPNIILFIPVISVSLYKIMDKIMLGLISNVIEVGYYESAEKIINAPLAIITALGTIMLPHISNILDRVDKNKINYYIDKSIKFLMFMAYAMCFGLIAIGKTFAVFYFGLEFEKTGILIMILATTIPFIAFANILRTQYLIPNEKDKVYIISTFLGAFVNLLINLMLIPKLSSIGACIGTIGAEIVVAFYQTIYVRKELDIKKYIIETIPFFIKAIIMYLIIYALNYLIIDSTYIWILQITLGFIVYCILNIKYIFSILNIKRKKEYF